MNNLKIYRRRLGLSQYKLADKTGVTRTTLNRLETGALPMTVDMANRLAPFFECSADDLLGEDKVRTIIKSSDKSHRPSFQEALKGFVSSFGKEYNDVTNRSLSNPAFRDSCSIELYKAVEGMTSMTYQDLKRVVDFISKKPLKKNK